MRVILLVIIVALVIAATYYSYFAKPNTPTVIVKASDQQQNQQQNTQQPVVVTAQQPTPFTCDRVYVKIANTIICGDIVYVSRGVGYEIYIKSGWIQGSFIFTRPPACPVTTTPQYIMVPCDAVITVPVANTT